MIFSKKAWLFLIAAAVVLFAPVPLVKAAAVERTIEMKAGRFAYSPGEIHVNPGDRVTIRLSAVDVVHGLSIDGYGVEMTAEPGQTATLSFTAARPGMFRLRCTVTCGNMHPFMIGKLYVGPNLLLLRGALLAVLSIIFGGWMAWKSS